MITASMGGRTVITTIRRASLVFALSALPLGTALAQQSPRASPAQDNAPAPAKMADPSKEVIEQAISNGVQLLLQMQESMDEGGPKAEWPYEGVYRVNRQIPVGYRVGGTSIACMALLAAPAYADDEARKAAVERALRFVLDASKDPLMNPDYDGGYDVRGWGYTYRLLFLLALKHADAVPAAMSDEIEKTVKWDIDAIQQTEIPKVGGWNYARAQGKDAVSPPSPFMTAPTLEALFTARSMGYAVDDAVVSRAIDTLVKQRSATGSFVYAGASRDDRPPEPVPGSVGRMLAGETTLFLCGKSDLLHIRGAIDAFITHWEWLDKRRAQNGTHIPPYNIAPYYFYYAHYYAARAIEFLPARERPEYRRRLARLLFSVRLDDGSWNDRVFSRSRNYGTSMVMMALLMPEAAPPARWESSPTKKDAAGD
jgi:hypothetical protein